MFRFRSHCALIFPFDSRTVLQSMSSDCVRTMELKHKRKCMEEEQIEDPLGLCDHRDVSPAVELFSTVATSSGAQSMPPAVFAVPERDDTLLQPTHRLGHDTRSVYRARLPDGQICVVKFFKNKQKYLRSIQVLQATIGCGCTPRVFMTDDMRRAIVQEDLGLTAQDKDVIISSEDRNSLRQHLQTAHNVDVTHQQMGPKNLCFREDARLCLIDVAKALQLGQASGSQSVPVMGCGDAHGGCIIVDEAGGT